MMPEDLRLPSGGAGSVNDPCRDRDRPVSDSFLLSARSLSRSLSLSLSRSRSQCWLELESMIGCG